MKPCHFCEQPVDTDDPDNYVEVTSWVNGPKLDGPKLRSQTGKVAHEHCIKNLAHGQAVDQPDLFEPDRPAPQHPRSSRGKLCDAPAQKGTGIGICGAQLDEHGECFYASAHLEV